MFLCGDPYERASITAMEKHLRTMWDRIEPELKKELREKEWTGIAGTPTTLAGMQLKLADFDGPKIDGYRMNRCDIADWFESLATQTQAQRKAEPLMGTGRADIMVAGVAILLTAMEYFRKEELVVSSRGLRHGVLLSPPTA
jgi:exopolyphosphatase/guanosine-5'-triphosphate,3'-diphosphate pyrophosphatase